MGRRCLTVCRLTAPNNAGSSAPGEGENLQNYTIFRDFRSLFRNRACQNGFGTCRMWDVSIGISWSRRGPEKALHNASSKAQAVTVAALRENTRRFLTALDTVLRAAPKDIGGMALEEVEIHAQLDSKGNLGILGILGLETAVQGGIKFVLRKKA